MTLGEGGELGFYSEAGRGHANRQTIPTTWFPATACATRRRARRVVDEGQTISEHAAGVPMTGDVISIDDPIELDLANLVWKRLHEPGGGCGFVTRGGRVGFATVAAAGGRTQVATWPMRGPGRGPGVRRRRDERIDLAPRPDPEAPGSASAPARSSPRSVRPTTAAPAWRTPSSTPPQTPAPTRSSSRRTSRAPRARPPSPGARRSAARMRHGSTTGAAWSFPESVWHELRAHADEQGLLFLSSPFSLEAVELLTRVGVAGWKVASGEINNHALLDVMAKTGLPIMLSTGMSPPEEIDAAVRARAGERRSARGDAVHVGVPVPARAGGAEPDPGLPRALRLRGRAVGPLGDDLPRHRRRAARHRVARGAHHALARDVRAPTSSRR